MMQAFGSTSGGNMNAFGKSSVPQSDIDQLVAIAEQRGGSVSEVIQELVHPNRSILSTIGNGFKKSFSSFVDIISIPNQVVAGIISKDKTISQAVKENISTSDVLFGKAKANQTTAQKVGGFIARTAVDILLDPLTYVSFGATRGVLGIKGLTKIAAEANIAEKLGVKAGDKIALSVAGEDLVGKFINAKMSGLRATFLKNEGVKIANDAAKAGKTLSHADIAKQLVDVDNKSSDWMIQNVLNQKLDRKEAGKLLQRMFASPNTKALWETYFDKGGLKLFGRSVVSAQRINGVIKAIPGMTIVDELTKPMRNTMGALFDSSRSMSGKLPSEFVEAEQKWRGISEHTSQDFLKNVSQVWRDLKITKEEDEFIRAAIETNKVPSDKRLAQVYFDAKGIEMRPEVGNATRFAKRELKKSLTDLRAAGVPTSELANYVPHILVKDRVQVIPFSLPPATKANATKFAKVSTFVDKLTGDRVPGFAEVTADGLKVKTPAEKEFALKSIKEGKVPGVDADGQGGMFVDMESGAVYERVRATVEEAEQLGVKFEKGMLASLVYGRLDTIKKTTMTGFLKDIAQQGVPASMAPTGFVPPGTKAIKGIDTEFFNIAKSANGEELYYHPEIAKRIDEFVGSVINDEPTKKVMEKFDKLQGYWKASVTSVFPAFHGRNAISNVFLNYLDLGLQALNPATHIASANLINKERQFSELILEQAKNPTKDVVEKITAMQNETVFKDRHGYNWSFGEMRRLIKDHVIAFNPNIVGALDVTKSGKDEARSLMDNLYPELGAKQTAKKVLKTAEKYSLGAGRTIGNLVEEQARLVNFMSNLKTTGDPSMAAMRTKQFLFDYQNLSKFEKTFLRRLMPFYTFSRKNIELQVKTLFSNPGRISSQIFAMNNLGDVLSGGQLTAEEKDSLPSWMQSSLSILAKRNGSQVELLQSVGTPIEAAFQQLQPNSLLSSVSPFLKTPVEQLSGYSFFHGKAISEINNAQAFRHAPAAIKNFIGYEMVTGERSDGSSYEYDVSLRPQAMHLILNLPFTSRVLSSLKQFNTSDVSDSSRVMELLMGVKVQAFDLEVEAARREQELRKDIEDILTKARVGYTFRRFITTEE